LARYELVINKVLNGQDNRTTLMIKNIPNKYDQEMLLEAINKNFKGTYDFFYLPIDFKNKCNVGYAFINFIHPSTLVPFHEEFNHKKWEKFNSEKVCFITYARIQGKLAFIDHFRNSSLMYEDQTCRPLIFHSSGPNMGELEPFPPANVPRPREPEGFLPGNILRPRETDAFLSGTVTRAREELLVPGNARTRETEVFLPPNVSRVREMEVFPPAGVPRTREVEAFPVSANMPSRPGGCREEFVDEFNK